MMCLNLGTFVVWTLASLVIGMFAWLPIIHIAKRKPKK